MTLFALAMISLVTERRGETRGSCLGVWERGPVITVTDRIIILPRRSRAIHARRRWKGKETTTLASGFEISVISGRRNRRNSLLPCRSFRETFPSPACSAWQKIKNRSARVRKRKGKRKGKSRLITGVRGPIIGPHPSPRQKRNRASPTVITRRTTVEHN